MKKILAIILSVIMLASMFVLVSCEDDKETTTITETEVIESSTESAEALSDTLTETADTTDIEVDPPVDSETDTSAVG